MSDVRAAWTHIPITISTSLFLSHLFVPFVLSSVGAYCVTMCSQIKSPLMLDFVSLVSVFVRIYLFLFSEMDTHSLAETLCITSRWGLTFFPFTFWPLLDPSLLAKLFATLVEVYFRPRHTRVGCAFPDSVFLFELFPRWHTHTQRVSAGKPNIHEIKSINAYAR